jgi:signal transduction histidine kinase
VDSKGKPARTKNASRAPLLEARPTKEFARRRPKSPASPTNGAIQTGLTEPLPLVLGHHGQLQQVILNLVRNAADAMESVSVRPRMLTVNSAVDDSDGVLVTVEDSGKGIDPENIDRIFGAFFTTKSEGLGMGLSICRSIIEDHHRGRLWASPDVNHGSVFNVQLPAFRPEVK